MHHHPQSLSPLLFFFISVFLLFSTTKAASNAHNITRILAQHPEFSTFNHYLSATHLANEINRRVTITVCAVDNAAMAPLLDHHFSLATIKNILSLHVFADYFGSKKLHQIAKGSTTTSSLFQATGEAAGTSGYVNITDMKGGKVGFVPVDAPADQPMASFVKAIEERPYVISVIQISHIMSSPDAEAPTASPSDLNVTDLMKRQGCEEFSDLIVAQNVADVFQHSIEGGLTVFCPSDEVLDDFMPKYKNLSADNKTSLVLFHGLPEYNSLGMLRSSNGLMNTLATDGAKKYDFTVQNDGNDVTLKTKIVTATIQGTLIDNDPLAVYKIDQVLLPRELFKAEDAPAVAPSPKSAKSKPKSSKSGSKSGGGDDFEDGDAPEPSSDDEAAADEESSSGGYRTSVVSGGLSLVVSGVLACFSWFFCF